VALGIVLVAATNRRLMQGYHHPKWMLAAGWVVVVVMGWLSVPVLVDLVGGFLR
jgi:Mn2+/Fe2+ NRAMP family transporter